MANPTAMTFETGYTRLQAIAERVTSEDVPVAEMCDLFAEGKGLQVALTKYLDEQKGRVEAIERGEGIQAFRIVTPAVETFPADDEDFAPAPPATPPDFASPPSALSSSGDDDIPF
jgi:exonuclease VII small subunit